jgi:hypothetical protein
MLDGLKNAATPAIGFERVARGYSLTVTEENIST